LKDDKNITPKEMLLWIMRERFKMNSKFKIYFQTLPDEFRTGLRFDHNVIYMLEGTETSSKLHFVKGCCADVVTY